MFSPYINLDAGVLISKKAKGKMTNYTNFVID